MKRLSFVVLVTLGIPLFYNACGGKMTSSRPAPTDPGKGGWRKWTKDSAPNWRGEVFNVNQYSAADPTVIKDGPIYHMYYTCLSTEASLPSGLTSAICHVTSTDGRAWVFGPSIDSNFQGVVFRGVNGTWEEEIETVSVIKEGSNYLLSYSGYPREVSGTRAPAQLGLATSVDGITFTRSSSPVLTPTAAGRDASDLFSSIMFPFNGLMRMIYVGWCVPGYHGVAACTHGSSIQLLAASRSVSGTWVKEAAPVLESRTDIAWMLEGVAEPALLEGPNGFFYLFFTGGLGDNEPRVTGLARSRTPFGPWEINPQPIVKPSGIPAAFDACGSFAPSVRLENNLVRMWFLGLDDCNGTCASCNFASCGCVGKFGIGYAEAAWPLD